MKGSGKAGPCPPPREEHPRQSVDRDESPRRNVDEKRKECREERRAGAKIFSHAEGRWPRGEKKIEVPPAGRESLL